MDKLIVILIFTVFLSICRARMKYNDYVLYEITATNSEQVNFLEQLNHIEYINISYWHKPMRSYSPGQVLVKNGDETIFLERIAHFNLKARVLISNLHEALENQHFTKYVKLHPENFTTTEYVELPDIEDYLYDIYNANRNEVHLLTIGQTSEGRDIIALKVGVSFEDDEVERIGSIVFEAGMHGHEWVTTNFVLYMIQHVLDDEIEDIFKKYICYFLPVMNPDGYAYSQSEDRFWRKSRRQISNFTYGVDLNRNFPATFGVFDSSKNPNNKKYCGPKPLSEPETISLKHLLDRIATNVTHYFSLHSYGEKIIIPYSTDLQRLDNHEVSENLADQASAAIYNRTQKIYNTGTFYEIYGSKVSGTSADWVKQQYKIPFVYTILMRDDGTLGYALPSSEIEEACKDALIAVKTILTSKVRRLTKTRDGIVHLVEDIPSAAKPGLRSLSRILVYFVTVCSVCSHFV